MSPLPCLSRMPRGIVVPLLFAWGCLGLLCAVPVAGATRSSAPSLSQPLIPHNCTGGLAPRLVKTPKRRDGTNLPKAFDGGTEQLSGGCATFFRDALINNSTFQDCVPMSALILTSNSFFHDESSAISTSHVLDAACSSSAQHYCSDAMSYLLQQLLQKDHCAEEYKSSNPSIIDAYASLSSYDLMRDATCLRNPDSNDYCYVDLSIGTASNNSLLIPDLYYVPLGRPLPASSKLPCHSKCLTATLNIFASAAKKGKGKLPIDNTYGSASQQANSDCGPDFAPMLKSADTSGAVQTRHFAGVCLDAAGWLYILAFGVAFLSSVVF